MGFDATWSPFDQQRSATLRSQGSSVGHCGPPVSQPRRRAYLLPCKPLRSCCEVCLSWVERGKRSRWITGLCVTLPYLVDGAMSTTVRQLLGEEVVALRAALAAVEDNENTDPLLTEAESELWHRGRRSTSAHLVVSLFLSAPAKQGPGDSKVAFATELAAMLRVE